MLVKEPDNLEKILERRFSDHRIDEGRDLFPAIAENLGQTQNKHNVIRRYMLAASVTVALFGCILFLTSRLSQSPAYVTTGHQIPDVSAMETKGHRAPAQEAEKVHLSDAAEINVEAVSSPQAVQTFVEKAVQRGKIIKLPDGSKIVLESGSSVKYNSDFGKKERVIYLEGTAFFDVAKQEKLPFVVSTSRSVTTVLGTSFNISSSTELREDRITVYSGLVTFSHKDQSQSLQLAAGSSAVLNESEHLRIAKYRINASAWQTGRLVFEETRVKEVIEDLENYFGNTIAVSDPELLNCTFSGIFINPKIEEIISVISLSLNLGYEEKPDRIEFTGKGCSGL